MFNENHTTRVALVTGASRGLGLTLATFLAQRGWNLVINARGAEKLHTEAGKLREYGVRVKAVSGDVSDADHRADLVRAAESFGRLDLLVNNASGLGVTPLPSIESYPLEGLVDVLQTNVVAPVALVQATLPLLKAANGLVINLSSDAARGGYEGWGGYGASKAALDLISVTLANELRDEGVGVVSVDPGDMRTDMHQAAFPGEDISDRPTPDATLPFWAWLMGQDPLAVSGTRYQAQAEQWQVAAS